MQLLQLHDVFGSVWFSAVYLLLFVSLIGCVIPRTKHHWDQMRAAPPRTPANLNRLAAYHSAAAPEGVTAATAVDTARTMLKAARYRTAVYDQPADARREASFSVSAERGYLRETGNLVFHVALIGVLAAIGIGGGFSYNGQKLLVERSGTFSDSLLAYDSFNPGRFFDAATLPRYTLALDEFQVNYEESNLNALGQPVDFRALVTTALDGQEPREQLIRVNEPLLLAGQDIYLLGNGYAPVITVRDAGGRVVYTCLLYTSPSPRD